MVIVADVWKNTSIVVFFILAGLQTISSRPVRGRAHRRRRRVARPSGGSRCRCSLPAIAVVLILRTIEAFKVFDIIYVMTGGGPASGTQTVAFYTYLQAFSNQLFGYGAALAYLIVLAVFAWRWATCGCCGRGRWQVSSEAQSDATSSASTWLRW